MPAIELGYGLDAVKFDYDSARFDVLAPDASEAHPFTDAEIGAALDAPIDSRLLEDLVQPRDSVLIVASDATRATGSPLIINLLVRRLIQNGIAPGDIAIIFATGIHRRVRSAEKLELLSPFIAQRIRTIDHDAYDASQLIQIGVNANGAAVKVNRALKEFSNAAADAPAWEQDCLAGTQLTKNANASRKWSVRRLSLTRSSTIAAASNKSLPAIGAQRTRAPAKSLRRRIYSESRQSANW